MGFIYMYTMYIHTRNTALASGDWQEEIQAYISPDNLPQAYGGTRCEPDSWCTGYVSIIYGYDGYQARSVQT